MSAPNSIRVTVGRRETSCSGVVCSHQVLLWVAVGSTRTFSFGARQVRMLELERTQHKLLLESLQKRHQEDLELLENAHRYQALWLCQVLACSPVSHGVGVLGCFPNPSLGRAGTEPC